MSNEQTDEPTDLNQTVTPDEMQAAAAQALSELRGEVILSPELEEMRRQPLAVRLGAGLGAMVAGAEQELRAELIKAGAIEDGAEVPGDLFEAAVLKPLLWALVAVAQGRGLELDALTDEIVTAWTTPEEGPEGGQEGATETAGEGVAQQG